MTQTYSGNTGSLLDLCFLLMLLIMSVMTVLRLSRCRKEERRLKEKYQSLTENENIRRQL